jgi:hypothetical protein
MEFFGFNDRIPVQAISQWLWPDSRNFAPHSKLATLTVNFRIEEIYSLHQKPTLRKVS